MLLKAAPLSPAPWCSGCATAWASSVRPPRSGAGSLGARLGRRGRGAGPVRPGAPHWRPEARGLLSGLSRGTTRAHIARAVLEGIALQNCDLLGAMEADAGLRLSALRVDGGRRAKRSVDAASGRSARRRIVRPKMLETTALGAALLAGLGVGLWPSIDAVRSAWQEDRRFQPNMPAATVATMKGRWAEAVKRA